MSGVDDVSEGGAGPPGNVALVVVDMIHGCVEAHLRYIADADPTGAATSYYPERMREIVIPNHMSLLREARRSGVAVVYTVLGSEYDDYRDLAPNLRDVIRARGVRRGTKGFRVLDELEPQPDDLVLTKLGSGAWATTTLDDVLRHSRVHRVLVTGTVTNGCVLTTALGAWDQGYKVDVVEDATCTLGQNLQDRALDCMRGFGIGTPSTLEAVSEMRLAISQPA